MEWAKEFLRRATVLIRRTRFESEIDEELEFHRAMEAEANERVGMRPRDAQRAAGRRLGNMLWLREESREQWAGDGSTGFAEMSLTPYACCGVTQDTL